MEETGTERVPTGGKRRVRKKRFYIVENPHSTPIHVLHPSGGKDIKLGAYEARVINKKEWKDSPEFIGAEAAGLIETYTSHEPPEPVPSLPTEAPSDPRSRRAIFEMAFGEGKVEDQLLAMDIINLEPRRVIAYGEREDANIDRDYLKNVHFYDLKWALWLLESFGRAKYKDRIPVIKKRMEEIRGMP